MKTKIHKLRQGLKTLLMLFILIAVSYMVYRNSNQKALSKAEIYDRVVSVFKKCKVSGQELYHPHTECVTSGLKKFVDKNNFPMAVDALEEIFTSDKAESLELGFLDCHTPGHVIGQTAYERGASFSEILKGCSNKCGFGCLHGAFQLSFLNSVKEDFLGKIDTICSSQVSPTAADSVACWHIVGHGIAEYFGSDVEEATKTCVSSFPFKPAWHCLAGILMEYVEPATWNPNKSVSSIDDYLTLCGRFPELYRKDCFGDAGYVALKIFRDENGAIAVCRKVPNDLIIRRKCAASGGGTYAIEHLNYPEEIFSFCQKYGGKEMVDDCLISAVAIFASAEDRPKTNGPRLCALVDSSFRRECLAFFGEVVQRTFGQEVREAICRELPAQENKYCLGNPVDSRVYLWGPE